MNEIDIRLQLKKILKSNAFSTSALYKKLLEYLTNATLRGEKPKEFTIGHEVFSQESDDSSTSKVRVAVYKLRKRIEKYYEEEGERDLIYFTIPKGGYSLDFTQNKTVIKKNKNKNLFAVLSVIVLSALISIIIYKIQLSDYSKLNKTIFWSDLINNKLNTVIVAGDFFVFSNKNLTGKEGASYNIRDMKINSEQDLRDFINANDSLKLEDFTIPTNTSYFQRDALFSMPYLIPVLERNKINYEIVLSSNFNWELFNGNNIIYIGVFNNMKSLSFLNQKLNISYDLKELKLNIYNADSLYTYFPHSDESSYTDFVFVAKIPGPHNNVIYLFNSIFDIACIEAVKNFTLLSFVKEFEKQNSVNTSYYNAIYKVESIKRSAVSFTMVEYNSISDSTLNIFWK